MTEVEQYLKLHQINFVLHEHPAVFTCEDIDKYCDDLTGLDCKNLFLRDQKGKRHFLFVFPSSKRVELDKICEIVDEKKLSFASAERLKEKLGLVPGAVSPFGLINDKNAEVEAYIDEEVYQSDLVNFHPNRNTATLELTGVMFRNYLQGLNRKINVFK